MNIYANAHVTGHGWCQINLVLSWSMIEFSGWRHRRHFIQLRMRKLRNFSTYLFRLVLRLLYMNEVKRRWRSIEILKAFDEVAAQFVEFGERSTISGRCMYMHCFVLDLTFGYWPIEDWVSKWNRKEFWKSSHADESIDAKLKFPAVWILLLCVRDHMYQ